MRRGSWILMAFLLLALVCPACAGIEGETGTEEPAEEEPIEEEAEPTPASTSTTPFSTVTPSGPQPTATPTVEERIAEVEWADSMRVGDGEVVRFSLTVSSEGAELSTPEIVGHQVETTTVPMPVARAGYDGYANASLAAAGLEVVEAGPSRQPLQSGGSNTWRWTIAAPRAGTYHPVINLTVMWEPQPGSDATRPIEEVVWSRVLTVEAYAPLGLSGSQVDWLGLGGTVLGTAAGFPFVEKVLSTLWRRLSGRGREEDADR